MIKILNGSDEDRIRDNFYESLGKAFYWYDAKHYICFVRTEHIPIICKSRYIQHDICIEFAQSATLKHGVFKIHNWMKNTKL